MVDLPPEPEGHTRLVRGCASQEKTTQEEREQSALSAVYMSPNQIPDSPAEPAVVLTDDEVDREVKAMSVGATLDALFQWGAEPMLPPPGTAASVAELVGQLAMGNLMDVSGGNAPGAGASQMDMQGAASATLAAVQGLLPQDQLQQLLAQLSSSAAAAAANPPYGLSTAPQQQQQQQQQLGTAASYAAEGWGLSLYDFGHHVTDDGAGAGGAADQQQQRGWADSGRGRGRGGGSRGRGRGAESKPYQYNGFNNARKKPCSFFAAGRRALNLNFLLCGDECD